MIRELWMDIDAHYQVSNLGRISSFCRKPRRILKPQLSKQTGYFMIYLGRGNLHYVHELVLAAFRGPRPKSMQASHLNGCRTDNRIRNLIWESRQENNARQVQHGTRRLGERNEQSILTEDQVKAIKAKKNPAYGWYTAIAKQYGVHSNTVREVHQGRTWRHING